MSPRISIIVTSFLEQSKPYLDLCIKSIQALDYPQELLDIKIVSPIWYKPSYDGVITIHPTKMDYPNGHALNWGALHADPKSDYLLFTNDDVCFTKNSLNNLIKASQSMGDKGIYVPASNDMQGKYWMDMPLAYQFRLNITAENKEHVYQTLMNAESPVTQQVLTFSDTLCLPTVLVPRPVWERVGEYDSSREGQDDVDYGRRILMNGLFNVIVLNSLVWHASGASADITMGPLNSENRAQSLKSYNEKWEKLDASAT